MVKKTLLSMAIAATVVGLAGCNVSSTDKYDNSVDTTPATAGQPGAEVSAFSPIFSPANGNVPLAIDILFADASDSDGTANTADTTPPVTTAINKLDGFSTVAPIYVEFNSEIDPDTVAAGQTVFLVKLLNAEEDPSIDALDIDTILASNPENPFSSDPVTPASYEARAIDMNGTGAIQILLKEPLDPKTKYMVIVTDGVKSRGGLDAGMSAEYSLVAGNLELPSADLDPVRDAVQGWQQLASAFLGSGSPLVEKAKGSSVLSYTFTTGGTTDVLKAMAAPGTFLESTVKQQITSIAAGEGAIKQATIAKELADGKTQPQAEAIAEGTLDFIAGEVATKINAGGGSLPTTDGATIRPTLKSTEALQPHYLAGLQNAATVGKQADVAAEIDMPTSRVYEAIINPDDGKALPVPYDDLLESQVAPQVAEQITSVEVGEGAIKQATIEKEMADGKTQPQAEAIAEGTLDFIAGEVATKINAGGGSLPTTDGATIRPTLKSTEALQPHYLAGLRAAATESKVEELSSKGSIYQGGLTIPNYLPASEAGKADAELGTWVASDDVAVAIGLEAAPSDVELADGTAAPKNVTYRFPFAKNLGDITIPVMATLPADAGACAKSNFTDGYPVVIYQHGITVDRTAGLLVGNALAEACVAMVAIDHAMHGVGPESTAGLVFNVEKLEKSVELDPLKNEEKSPFAAVRTGTLALDSTNWMKDLHERHNNVGKNAAQENVSMVFKDAKGVTAEADVGASGDLYINLQNFARTRDAMRQTVLDMMNLNASIGAMDIDGDGSTDLNADKVYFIGHSLGSIIGTTFVAVNNDPDVQTFNDNLPKIKGAIFGNGGGGVVKLLENSPSIGGAKILPGLKASAGLEQGSTDIEKFFGVMQAMVDSADPINFASAEHMQNLPILSYEAVGGVDGAKADLVVPNNALNATVATAKSYLAGTDPLVNLLGITTQYDQSTDTSQPQQNAEGIRANVRVGTGDHSTFSNADPQDTFAEIYGQIGSFILSAGKAVNVDNTDVLEPAE